MYRVLEMILYLIYPLFCFQIGQGNTYRNQEYELFNFDEVV